MPKPRNACMHDDQSRYFWQIRTMDASIARHGCSLQPISHPISHKVPVPFRPAKRTATRLVVRADFDAASRADILQSTAFSADNLQSTVSSSDFLQSTAASADILQSTADALQVSPGLLAAGAAAVGARIAQAYISQSTCKSASCMRSGFPDGFCMLRLL